MSEDTGGRIHAGIADTVGRTPLIERRRVSAALPARGGEARGPDFGDVEGLEG